MVVDGGPSPIGAIAELAILFGRNILLPSVDEAPGFGALNPLAFQVAKGLALVVNAGVAKLFGNRILGNPRQPNWCSEGIPLTDEGNNLGALGVRKSFHTDHRA